MTIGLERVSLGKWYSKDEKQPWENLDKDSPGKGNTLHKGPRQELQEEKGSLCVQKAMNKGRWDEMRPKISCRTKVTPGFVSHAEKFEFCSKDSREPWKVSNFQESLLPLRDYISTLQDKWMGLNGYKKRSKGII